MFQSTHPRGVRPDHGRLGDLSGRVSIHAPAWGATHRHGNAAVDERVSIHAPAWGATGRHDPGCYRIVQFQSTHPRGVRRPGHWRTSGSPTGFNPRTRVGCDPPAPATPSPTRWFQSTHPRGVRQPVLVPLHGGHVVSIHAPAWGATLHRPCQYRDAGKFQSTHPRGVRPRIRTPPWWYGCRFNPRTRVGCDSGAGQFRFQRGRRFNPRTRVGCDCFHVLSSRFP